MKRLIAFCGLFLLAFCVLPTNTVKAKHSDTPDAGVFFQIVANGEMAVALCFKHGYAFLFDEVLFKGPSGVKIRATQLNNANFMGTTTEFSLVGGPATLTHSVSTIFYKQNKPIPTIFVINGVVIAGISDSGAMEKELQASVQKEYGKLPSDFQQGLREFYQYCAKSNIGLVTIAASLDFILGEQLPPFQVDQVINRDPLAIQALQTEFNCN